MATRDPADTATGPTAGTARRDDGYPRAEVRRKPETKAFLVTSEFWVTVIAIVGLFIAAYGLDDIVDADAWKWSALVAIGYIVSRGIAKAASQRDWQRTYVDER